jgi:hypothetical protein
LDDGQRGNGMDREARVDDGKERGGGGGGVDNGQAPGIWKIPLLSDLGGSGPGGRSRHAGSPILVLYIVRCSKVFVAAVMFAIYSEPEFVNV